MKASTFPGHVLRYGDTGAAVERLQQGLRALGEHYTAVKVDGDFGPITRDHVVQYQERHDIEVSGAVGPITWAAIFDEKLGKVHASLLTRALDEAKDMVGVMEHGGNNHGKAVERIIHYARGQVPEPWCVDFVIWCYGHAGSKIVAPGYTRAVRYMDGPSGVARTRSPKAGDIVRYSFDHTGLFVKDNGDGTITTIEGNTGPLGAVSDSSTGGDGVYRKRRAKSLVSDYLHVSG